MTNDWMNSPAVNRIFGALYGMIIMTIFGAGDIHAPKNKNPEYVNPRTIEFIVDDKDFDGKKESYAKINGKDYLFKMENGTPKLVPYEIKKVTETVKTTTITNIEKIILEEK